MSSETRPESECTASKAPESRLRKPETSGASATPPIGEYDPLLGENSGSDYGSLYRREQAQSYTSLPALGAQRGSFFLLSARKAKYYVPVLQWIPNYRRCLLAGDILAGVTLASLIVPLSISFSTSLAHISPVAGLFAASFPPIIYAILGTSRQLSVGPEAPLSLIIGQAVLRILHDDKEAYNQDRSAVAFAVVTVVTLQVGLVSFVLGFFRLGFIDVILSRALLRGYVTSIAVIIFVQQLIPMFGLDKFEEAATLHNTVDRIIFLVENLQHLNRSTTAVAFGSLGVLVLLRMLRRAPLLQRFWWVRRMPEVLLVVVVSTVLSSQLHWDNHDIQTLGSVHVDLGSSFLQWPLREFNMKFFQKTTSTAAIVAVMGFLDSIVAAKQNATRFRYSISPNRELVALGTANLLGSFVPGTLPAYGSITRSQINGEVGARTQLASLVCASIVLLATFFLLPWMYALPICILSSILNLVVFSLLAEAPHDIIYYYKTRAWADLSLITLTVILSVLWNIELGIVVALVASLLTLVRRSSRVRMTILGRVPGTDTWKPIKETPEAEEDVPGVLIVRIKDSLDFANTAQLKERLRRLELYGVDASHPSEEPRRQQADAIVFHMADVETCDASAAGIFYELLETYKSRGTNVYIAHLRATPRQMFERAQIVALVGERAIVDNVSQAMALQSAATR